MDISRALEKRMVGRVILARPFLRHSLPLCLRLLGVLQRRLTNEPLVAVSLEALRDQCLVGLLITPRFDVYSLEHRLFLGS